MSITDEAQLLISCKSTGTATVNQFTDALGRANGASTALMKTLGGLFSTAAVVNFGRNAIRTYSDLEEATSKFYVVFSGLTKQADAEVEKLKQSFGASTLSARSMLSLTGNLLTGWGFGREESLKLSAQVAQLGSDLASFTNYAGGAEGATTAITKAMLGETEMAKMLGIAIKTDSEEFKTLKKELMETKGYTDTQAKALASLQIAMEQSKNAMGDFERTQDSIANRTRIVDNAFQELKANVGRGLADAFNDLQGGVLGLVQAYNKLDPETQDLITQTGAIFTVFMSLKTGMATYNALQTLAAGASANTATATMKEAAAHNANAVAIGAESAATKSLALSKRMDVFSADMKKLTAGADAVANGFGKMRSGLQAVQGAAVNAMAGIRGMIAAAAPMLILSAAIAGVNYILTRDQKAAEKSQKMANDKLEDARSQLQAIQQLHTEQQNQLIRYDELSRKQNRTVQEQQEMEKTANALNSAYKGLNLTVAELGKTSELSLEQQKKFQEQQIQEEKDRLREALSREVSNTTANLELAQIRLGNSGSFGNGLWNTLGDMFSGEAFGENYEGEIAQLQDLIFSINSVSDAEKAYNTAMLKGYDEVAEALKSVIAGLKNEEEAKEKLLELTKEQKGLEEKLEQARELARKKQEEEDRKKRLEQFNIVRDMRSSRLTTRQQYDNLSNELVSGRTFDRKTGKMRDMDGGEMLIAREKLIDLEVQLTRERLNRYSRSAQMQERELERERQLSVLRGDKDAETNFTAAQLDLINKQEQRLQRDLRLAGTAKEKLAIEEKLLSLAEKKASIEFDSELSQIQNMKERQAAQQEWLSNLMTTYGTFKATTQGAVMAGTAEAQRLQSRTFDTPGVTLESILKSTEKATEKIKDAVLQLEAKMSANASDVNRIRQRIEKLEVSGM